ncbi:hypothetical protein EJ903_21360 [Azospirillum griseum]|uniref:HAMP domain-containing protein n=2 Tax=Azospirillum griseum TaxID=2496639 RepID=A0A3S0JF50_9PROT|nr:hypothetical protein EJ903_21360 [Azospirillum griseum]
MAAGSFAARLAVFIVLATVLAAAAAVGLWTREQSRRLDEAVTSQAAFVLTEAKAALEGQLNLGLALADLPQVDGLLTRARAALPSVDSVAVLDEAATILFSTNAVEVGDVSPLGVVPPHGSTMAGGAGASVWISDVSGERVFGIGLTTSFDTMAGAILLRVPIATMTDRVRHYALTLSVGALAAGAPLALVAWVVGLWLAHTPRRALSAVAEALEGVEHNHRSGADGAAAGETLGLPVPGFLAAVRRRLGLLDKAEHEVSRLDELA